MQALSSQEVVAESCCGRFATLISGRQMVVVAQTHDIGQGSGRGLVDAPSSTTCCVINLIYHLQLNTAVAYLLESPTSLQCFYAGLPLITHYNDNNII
ncbi:hypothetical protein E2C01_069006 [Portunus trituberculatus]|uniref:Uncharacterized protein n=1 Tax=Portunus trituberculatus TaxID=210409 RepID=A0A5B7I121_PORTR|nr:hypothetical protein [Portunus trituberculatus]